MKQFLNFIGGEFVATGKTFENRAPVDNRVLGLVHEAGQREEEGHAQAADEHPEHEPEQVGDAPDVAEGSSSIVRQDQTP